MYQQELNYMKKVSVLWAVFCLLFAAGAVSAQERTTNFSGNWEINIAKSKLPERTRIEAMMMIVNQTADELTVETVVKRNAQPEMLAQVDANGGMRPDGNRAARLAASSGNINNSSGGIANFPGSLTYNLTGNAVVRELDAPVGILSSVLTLNANFEKNGRLRLTQVSRVTAESGESVTKTNDAWELSPDGKTLKVTREVTTVRGAQTAEMYFVKTDTAGASGGAMPDGISDTFVSSSDMTLVNGGQIKGELNTARDKSLTGFVLPQKQVAGGILNGKAVQLPKPAYPAAARAAKAKGAVNVEVTLGESGNVVAASAVSGHPLLRAAAVEAARSAKFAPTLIEGIPVKVSGIIVYNFVP